VRDTTLRQRCEDRVRHLPIPDPFDLATFLRRLGEQRGRPVELHALPGGLAEGMSGVWMATDRADHIYYDGSTNPLHGEHIVLHEVGHIVADHQPAPVLASEDAALLLPHLAGEVVARVLARTSYSREDEREAELTATLIARRAGRPAVPHADPDVDALCQRLRSALA